jgi:competence protein ComEA
MPTPAERKALLFVAAVALLGAGVRAARGAGSAPPAADPAIRAQLAAVDSARRERSARKGGQGARGGSRASRAGQGAGGKRGAEGTGQGGASRRTARASAPPAPPPGAPRVALPLGGVPVMSQTPGAPGSSARRRSRRSSAGGATRPSSSAPLDLDRASAAEIEALPRVGPVLARRIVEEREAGGPFGSLEGLERVRGVGPALARRLAPHVTFSGVPRQSHVAEPGNVRRSRRRAGAGPRPP